MLWLQWAGSPALSAKLQHGVLQVLGDGSFVIRRDGECNFFADKGCHVAPDTFELTPELESERRMSSENRLAMVGAHALPQPQ